MRPLIFYQSLQHVRPQFKNMPKIASPVSRPWPFRYASTRCQKAAPRTIARGIKGRGTRSIESILSRIESKLEAVEHEVEASRVDIRVVGDHGLETRRLWKPDTVELVHTRVLRIEQMLKRLGNLYIRGVQVFSPTLLAALLAGLGVILVVRHRIYATVAEESASLGKEVLKQNSRNLVETIDLVTRDPETLQAVQVLLVELLAQDHTRDALAKLLHATLQDLELKEAAGTFLVQSLETEWAKQALAAQMAWLAETTALDEQVQRSAATGLNATLRFAATHALLPNRWLSSSAAPSAAATAAAAAAAQTPPPSPRPPPPAAATNAVSTTPTTRAASAGASTTAAESGAESTAANATTAAKKPLKQTSGGGKVKTEDVAAAALDARQAERSTSERVASPLPPPGRARAAAAEETTTTRWRGVQGETTGTTKEFAPSSEKPSIKTSPDNNLEKQDEKQVPRGTQGVGAKSDKTGGSSSSAETGASLPFQK